MKYLDIMNRKNLLLAVMLVCGLALTACHKSDDKPEVPEYTEWTPGTHVDKAMLHYLATDDLSSAAAGNIADMVTGSTRANIGGNVTIVFQDIANTSPRLLAVFADKNGNGKMQVLKTFEESKNFADPDVLLEAFGYLKEYAPADSYVLAIGSHGSGWVPKSRSATSETRRGLFAKNNDLTSSNIAPRSIVHDYRGYMQLDDFSSTLETSLANLGVAKLDMIIFDECLAAGIEVMYNIKDHTRYAVASVTETWAPGIPYAKLMQHIFDQDPVAGGRKICDKFVQHYADQAWTSTLTLFDLSKFDDVSSVVKDVLSENVDNIQTLTISHLRSIQYYDRDISSAVLSSAIPYYWDLGEYLCAIAPEAEHDAIKAVVMPASGNLVNYTVTTPTLTFGNGNYNYGTQTIDMTKFSGITSYIPTSSIANYQGLTNKYKLTKWYQEAYPQP